MRRRAALTLPEVLVALALFALLASAAVALQLSALTLQRRAERLRAEVAALDAAAAPASLRRDGWDPCAGWHERSLPGTCRADWAACCGDGALRRLTLRVAGESGEEAVVLRTVARAR